jgi:hypothetical protein
VSVDSYTELHRNEPEAAGAKMVQWVGNIGQILMRMDQKTVAALESDNRGIALMHSGTMGALDCVVYWRTWFVENDLGEEVDFEYVILAMKLSCFDRARAIQSSSNSSLTSGHVIASLVSAFEDKDSVRRTAADVLNAPVAG